ncbi:MAG: hypothetical protein QXX12_02325 [Nanopusillaceae archaeon]
MKKRLLSVLTVFVIPAEYNNIYYSSLTSYASGIIRFGQPVELNDAGAVRQIFPTSIMTSGVQIMCYDIPKVQCIAGRVANITTNVKGGYITDGSRYLKLHSVYAGAFDLGNVWRVCATGVASTSVDHIRLVPCYTGGAGFCIALEYGPERYSTRFIADFNAIMAGRAVIEVSYKQNCM